jgi:hypothetical protein
MTFGSRQFWHRRTALTVVVALCTSLLDPVFNARAAAMGRQIPVQGTPPVLDPRAAAVNAELESEMKAAYDEIVKQAKALQGARNLDDIVIAEGTLVYAVMVRNLYKFQLSVHVGRMQKSTKQTREQKIEHIKRLQALAERLEFWFGVNAYLTSPSLDQTRDGQRFLREQADQAGNDKAKAAVLLNMAEHPESWTELVTGEVYALTDQDPVVGLSADFMRRLWSGYSAEELLPYYEETIANEIAAAEKEMDRVAALNTVEGMTEFFGPQYTRTRAAAAGMLGQRSQNLYVEFETFARSYEEHRDIKRDPLGLNRPLLIGALVVLTLIAPAGMPVLLAVLAGVDLAVAGYTLYHELPYLDEVSRAAVNAQAGRVVLGSEAVQQLNDQRTIVALGVFLNAVGIAAGGRALTRAAAEARAAEILRRTRAAFPVDGSVASVPSVQQGARRAAELGVPQGQIDTYLKYAAEMPTHAALQRLGRERGVAEDALEAWIEQQYLRSLGVANPFGQILNGVAKLDEDIAAAIASGVPKADVDAMVDAAVATRNLRVLGEELPLNLMRASANRQGITFVLERPFAGRFRDPGGVETAVTDVPLTEFRQFWNLNPPSLFVRANVDGLLDLRRKLANMGQGLRETLTQQERVALNEVMGRSDVRSLHYLIEDEGVAFRLFDDDLIDVGQRLLNHPNRDAIAGGLEILPRATGATNVTAPVSRAFVGAWILTGAALGEAIDRLRPRGGGASSPEQQLATAALDRAGSHFGQPAADWSVAVLPDGRVAVTSPDQMKRVTASLGDGSSGQPRIDFVIESRRDRFVDRESLNKGVIVRLSLPTPGTTLPALEGPTRPLDGAGAGSPAPTPGQPMRSTFFDGERSRPASNSLTDPAKPADLVTFGLGIRLGGGKPVPPTALNPETTQAAAIDTTAQSVLAFMDNSVVMARSTPRPSVDWRGLFASLISPARPRLSSTAIGERATSSWRGQTRTTPTESAPRLKAFVTSLGHLGADAFRVVLVNESSGPVELRLGDLVLEPVAGLSERDVQRELAARSRTPQHTFTVPGYCLERDKTPPAAGMVFRLAPAEAQARNAPASRAMRAARGLNDRKAFKPDTDPEEYFHSIVQWSIWTLEQKLDERSFSRGFVDHVRKRVIAGGQRWTSEIEKAVVALVPARWQAIQLVLREAGGAAR